MIFTVSEQKKKEIVNCLINSRSGLHFLAACSKWAVAAAVGVAIVHIALHYLIPGYGVTEVAGVEKIDIVSMISRAVLYVVIGVAVHYCTRFLLINRCSLDLLERTDEEMRLENEVLQYMFRTRYCTAVTGRIIVAVPLRDIRSVQYDAKLRKLILYGRISSSVVEQYDSSQKYHPNSGNLDELTIYDYFDPSLMQIFSDEGCIHG